MSPFRLVNLWRQRWGIRSRFIPTHEFSNLYVSEGVQEFVFDDNQRFGGPMTWLLTGVGLLLFIVAATIEQTGNSQVVFALGIVVVAFGVRRLAGRMSFLIVSGLALLMGARYLSWRLQSTIQPDWNAIPGILLWVAELFLVATFAFHMLTSAFPFVIRPAPPLPPSDEDPYVDVILIVPAGTSADAIQISEWIQTVRTQNWPINRLRFFVATDNPADRAMISGAGATPILHRGPVSDRLEDGFDIQMPIGNGEFILMLSTIYVDGLERLPRLIRSWIEWMGRDPKLAIIHTNNHRYMPANGQTIRDVMLSPREEYLLIRRADWNKVPAGAPFNARNVEMTGAHVATAGHPRAIDFDEDDLDQLTDWIRVDTSVPEKALKMRARVHWFDAILQAGAPTAWSVVIAGVLAIPILGYFAVNANFLDFVAYLLPFLALVMIAQNRSSGPLYRSIWQELRDIFYALFLPPLVCFNMLYLATRALLIPEAPRPSIPRIEEILALLLLFFALVMAIWRWQWADGPYLPWLVVSILCILGLMQTLTTRWAIRNERATLAESLREIREQSVALRLPDGRTLSTRALNFPELPLRLELESDGGDLITSGMHRLTFPNAHGTPTFEGGVDWTRKDGLVRFQPDRRMMTDYRSFSGRQQWETLRRVEWLPPPRLGLWLMSMVDRFRKGRRSNLKATPVRMASRQ